MIGPTPKPQHWAQGLSVLFFVTGSGYLKKPYTHLLHSCLAARSIKLEALATCHFTDEFIIKTALGNSQNLWLRPIDISSHLLTMNIKSSCTYSGLPSTCKWYHDCLLAKIWQSIIIVQLQISSDSLFYLLQGWNTKMTMRTLNVRWPWSAWCLPF